jgi:hypothetical protein
LIFVVLAQSFMMDWTEIIAISNTQQPSCARRAQGLFSFSSCSPGRAGTRRPSPGREFPNANRHAAQSVTSSPGTRSNSRRLSVTSAAPPRLRRDEIVEGADRRPLPFEERPYVRRFARIVSVESRLADPGR